MIARAIETVSYTAAIKGTHRAMSEMGFIDPSATGTQAEQVRAAIVGPPEAPAIEEGEVAKTSGQRKRAGQ